MGLGVLHALICLYPICSVINHFERQHTPNIRLQISTIYNALQHYIYVLELNSLF